MMATKRDREAPAKEGPRTLAIDVGGTGLKASVLDRAGKMLVERVRVATPYPCRPDILLPAIAGLATKLPAFDRISIGFPGVVRDGRVITAPHFDRDAWRDYPLQDALARQFGKPARLLNDAEVQGLGIIAGRGLELVLTLGTGAGTALFRDGALMPHLELAQHPIHKRKTYNDYIGDKALKDHGKKKWNNRLCKTIEILHSLLHYDTLYLAGGNAVHVELELPQNVKIGSNAAGITGGVHLWDADFVVSRRRRDA
jgi:polyphosphate glucokinase